MENLCPAAARLFAERLARSTGFSAWCQSARRLPTQPSAPLRPCGSETVSASGNVLAQEFEGVAALGEAARNGGQEALLALDVLLWRGSPH